MPRANWKTTRKKIRSIIALPLLSNLDNEKSRDENSILILKEILNVNKKFLKIIDSKSDSISIGLRVIIQVMEKTLEDTSDNTSFPSINRSMVESTLRLLKMADEIGMDEELSEVKEGIYKTAWKSNIPIGDMYSRIKNEEAEA